jgi:hypothetical protein
MPRPFYPQTCPQVARFEKIPLDCDVYDALCEAATEVWKLNRCRCDENATRWMRLR